MELPYNDLNIAVLNTIHSIWNETSYSYLDRPRPDNGFLLVLEGHIDYIFDDRIICLGEKDFIFLPMGSKYNTHMYVEEGRVETILINFYISKPNPYPIPPFTVLKDSTDMIGLIMKRVFTESLSRPKQHILAKSDMFLLYHTVLAMFNDEDSDAKLIRYAKLMLSGSEALSIENIAQKLLVSSSGLRKKFKDFEGVSPKEYRLKCRLDNAKLMLVSTDLSINEISEKCGFYDTAYFYKVFCRRVGITPKKYRETSMVNI